MRLRQIRHLLISLSVLLAATYSLSQSTAEDWYKAGYAAEKNKDYATALADFKRSLQMDPQHANAWLWLGFTYSDQKQYEQARDTFLKYLTLPDQPDKGGALLFLGITYENLNQYEIAADTFRTLRRFTNDRGMSWKAQQELGHALAMHGSYAAAIDELQKAINLEVAACDASGACADSERVRSDLGFSFYRLQRYSEALAAFQEAARLKPDDSDDKYLLGMTYLRLGRRAEALAEYQELLSLDKNNAAELYAEIQKTGNAPASPPPKQNVPQPSAGKANASGDQCKSQVDAGDYANAIEVCKKAVATAPFNADAWSNLGMAYFGSKHHSEAAQAYEQVIRLRPNDAHAHYGIGAAYEEMQQYDKAIPQLREAVRLDASNASQWYDLGECLYLTGQFPAAEQALEKAANLEPNDSATDYWLGRTYVKLGQRDAALAAYNRMIGPDGNRQPDMARQLDSEINAAGGGRNIPRPADPRGKAATNATDAVATLLERCRSYYDAKDYAKAVEACKKTVELDRNNVPAYINWGASLNNMDRNADAIAVLRQAVQLDPNSADAWSWLGLDYFATAKLPEAADALEKAVRLAPSNTQIYEELGNCYYAMGRKSDALTVYHKLLATDRQAAEELHKFMSDIDDMQRKVKQQAN